MVTQFTSSPSTRRFKVTPSAVKFMLTVFRESQEVLLAHFQDHGENVNSAKYREVLLTLKDATRRKPPDKLARGYCSIMAMPDPIQPEQPRNFFNVLITARTWPILTYICLVLQSHLSGKCFADDEEVEPEMQKWQRH
jgi:hypothetical protein